MLLYGSQKGQAQSIAEGVAEVAEEHGLVAELSCLDTNAKVAMAYIQHFLVQTKQQAHDDQDWSKLNWYCSTTM